MRIVILLALALAGCSKAATTATDAAAEAVVDGAVELAGEVTAADAPDAVTAADAVTPADAPSPVTP